MKCTVFATITSLIKQLYTPELEGRNVSCYIQCKYFDKSFAKYYWCIYKANKNTSFSVSVITVLCQNGFFRLTKLVLHLHSFRLNKKIQKLPQSITNTSNKENLCVLWLCGLTICNIYCITETSQ